MVSTNKYATKTSTGKWSFPTTLEGANNLGASIAQSMSQINGPVGKATSGITADSFTEKQTTDVSSKPFNSIGDLFTQSRQTIGQPTQITVPDLPNVKETVSSLRPILGLGQEFYDSQREQMKDALRKEFFGPLGTAQQAASNESAAGRLGSGVGKRVLEETVSAPYAQGLIDIDREILQSQLQEDARIGEYSLEIAKTQSANQFEAQQANANLAAKYDELAYQMATAQSSQEYNQAIMELQALQAIEEAQSTLASQGLDITSVTLSPAEYGLDFLNQLKAQGMDVNTARTWLEAQGDAYNDYIETWDNLFEIVYGASPQGQGAVGRE